MQTTLASCVGAAKTLFDQAQASAMVEHDKMTDSLVKVTTAVGDYRKSMGPQNHERDALVTECEKLWQFSAKSYEKRASLNEEKAIITAEKAGVKSWSHTTKVLDDGSSIQVAFTMEMRSKEFAALETRATAIRTALNGEEGAIFTEITGKETVPTAPTPTIMEWPTEDDVQCAELQANWTTFTELRQRGQV